MHDVHVLVKPSRTAKQQALEALPALQTVLPIVRSRVVVTLQVTADGNTPITPFVVVLAADLCSLTCVGGCWRWWLCC
jgi:hypothetical protein